MLSHVLGVVDKTSSSFSAHSKIGNFIIIIIINVDVFCKIIRNRHTLTKLCQSVSGSGIFETRCIFFANNLIIESKQKRTQHSIQLIIKQACCVKAQTSFHHRCGRPTIMIKIQLIVGNSAGLHLQEPDKGQGRVAPARRGAGQS